MTKEESHQQFKPSDFMRDRHPDLFSDTIQVSKIDFSKDQFKFILHRLTEDEKEILFQEFCYQLAKLELFPNIRPQTGPLGGGDAGIDADTYPVDPELAEIKYWDSLGKPTADNVAFAFSCHGNWKSKATNDIDKIIKLEKGYTKIIFISNQSISSKKRITFEKYYLEKYNIQVSILDRIWIVETVFSNDHIRMAINTLNIDISSKEEFKTGIRDFSRQQLYDEILNKLREPSLNYFTYFGISEDYYQASYLARCLGKSQSEFENLIDHAITNAQKTGSTTQIIKCIYFKGWSQHWFYNDPQSMYETFNELILHTSSIVATDDLEYLYLLYTIVLNSKRFNILNVSDDTITNHGLQIIIKLDSFINDASRPYNSLHAKYIKCLLNIHISCFNPDILNEEIRNLHKLFKDKISKHIPVRGYIENILMLGEILAGNTEYNQLINLITSLKSNISKEINEGEVHFKHGMNLSKQKQLQESIYYLGKAKLELFKEDTLYAVARASLRNSLDLAELGFYWAARLEALSSVQICLAKIEKIHEFPLEAGWSALTMAQLEIWLGRLKPFFAWHRLCCEVLPICIEARSDIRDIEKQMAILDGMFSLLLLKVGLLDIQQPQTLLVYFKENNMWISEATILFMLGRNQEAINALSTEVVENEQDLIKYMDKTLKSPMAECMPESLTFQRVGSNKLTTCIMGVNYTIFSANKLICELFSEFLLGIIELLYCLMDPKDYAWIINEIIFHIDENATGNNPPHLKLDKMMQSNHINLFWSSDALSWLRDKGRNKIAGYMIQLMGFLEMSYCIDPLEDLKKRLDIYHKNDHFSRVFNLNNPFITIPDVLGYKCYE